MLEVGWSEILVIAVVLIVVVGPKDLPPMLRAFGKMTTKLRAMAGQFQTQFSEALKEADLDDVRKTIQDAQKLNPLNTLREAITPIQQMGNELKADLQKTVATPASNPTVLPVVTEAADAVSKAPAEATATPAIAANTGSAEASVSIAAPAAAVASVADDGKKPKKVTKPKETASEGTAQPVVSADEPQQKAKRTSRSKAVAAPANLVVAIDDQGITKKKKAAKSAAPEGDA